MNNSILHGFATTIELTLYNEKDYYIIILKDNGTYKTSFPKERKVNHFGLDLIKNKLQMLNSELKIDLENGTKIILSIPISMEKKNDY